MRRRDFLKQFRKPALLLAAAPVAAAAVAPEARSDADRLSVLRRQYNALRQRMDRMDAAQKRTTRILLGVAAVTIGIDISLLI